MSRRALAARLACVLLVAGTMGIGAPAPAQAAACTTDRGVTVVVDHHDLGGGVVEACVSGGGSAAELFTAAGQPLTYAQREPGFVCRVRGLPQDDPCVVASPPDATWALYWSDGTSGRWAYSTLGAESLTVPEGGYVALSWQGSSTKSPPSTTPGEQVASGGSAGSDTDVTAPTDAASTDDTAPTAAEPADDTLPTWVPLVAVALLALMAGATVVLRRRSAAS